MEDLTGLFMGYNRMGDGGHMMSPGWWALVLVLRVVVGFLFVWLCVWLLNRWGMAPFGKKGKK